jgi:hypothetical protein
MKHRSNLEIRSTFDLSTNIKPKSGGTGYTRDLIRYRIRSYSFLKDSFSPVLGFRRTKAIL